MKVAVTGIGRVGVATAFALVLRGTADELVLVSRDPTRAAEGHARDLAHAGVFLNSRPTVVSSGTVDDARGCDLVIVTNSVPSPPPPEDASAPAVDRLGLAGGNHAILRDLMPRLAEASPDAVFLILSNPVDAMTHVAIREGNLSPRRVMGSGTLIDTGRFRESLARLVGGHPRDVRAYILGEHGDSMVPALSQATIAGMKLPFTHAQLRSQFEAARRAGYDVVRHKGYTDHAIATCASLVADAVARDTREVMPLSTLVDGPYGLRDVCLSLPCVVGRRGVEKVLTPDLDEGETAALRGSAEVIRGVLAGLYDGSSTSNA